MIFVSIGSNIGQRLNNLRRAVLLLEKNCLSNIRCSIVLETQAILPLNSSSEWNKSYLNMVVCGESEMSSYQLLQALKSIENEIGRLENYDKWSPRVIDLDILLYNNEVINTSTLQIPHSELLNRNFLIHLIAMLDPLHHYSSIERHTYNNKTFGEIAHSIENINQSFTKSFVLFPKLVGIVNVTPDSFSDGGENFNSVKAVEKTLQLISDGATVVELGPQSTRPSAIKLTHEEEFKRLKPVLDGLKDNIENDYIKISIDTFWPETVHKVLQNYSIAIINDVKGDFDDKTLQMIAEYGCKIIIMHSLTIPPNKNTRISDEISAIDSIYTWADATVNRLLKCGFTNKNIIIDPGIGFGKSAYQNIQILRDIKKLKKFGCPILVGHSRKGYINSFHNEILPQERDLETIAVSNAMRELQIDYLRVHNIADHQRLFVAQEVMKGFSI
jgi:2-amino-4-hydroxy-6-hydroxymethyldihydropteridine diphosphokinase/dihydropteroate synthase